MLLPYTNNAKTDFEKCSFCLKPETATRVLITGDEAAICENCIIDANATLLKEAGFIESFSAQFSSVFQKIQTSLTLILFLLAIATVVIVVTTIFMR